MMGHTAAGCLRNASLFASIAALATGCSTPPPPAVDVAESELTQPNDTPIPSGVSAAQLATSCPIPADHALFTQCPIYSCGNAAKIGDAMLGALDLSGIEMQPGTSQRLHRLVTGSKGGCAGRPAVELMVYNGEFVGLVNGMLTCWGADMVGASFFLESDASSTLARVTIDARSKVSTLGSPSENLPTYSLSYRFESTDGGMSPSIAISVCGQGSWTSETATLTYHALIIQGEVYDQDATVIRRGYQWINIACAGSALAKLRLHGMNPMMNRNPEDSPVLPGTSTIQQRQSALKLMTAKYCGTPSWTVDGTQIYWRSPVLTTSMSDTASTALSQEPTTVGPIESRWGSNGALCISHLRLWSAGSTCADSSEQPWVEQIQRDCNIPACDESEPCPEEGASSDPATLWWTCTANHVSHDSLDSRVP
jgi:hypothetical protein